MRYFVNRTHLCPDCSTPKIDVTSTGVIARLHHDPECPTKKSTYERKYSGRQKNSRRISA